MGQEVKIKIRAFPYYEKVYDPLTDTEVQAERIARRGDVIELNDKDLERAKRFDAVVDPDEDLPQPGSVPPPEDSVEGLVVWLQADKPTEDEIVERAEGNPELAQRLIEAENIASGQQPRDDLVERLEDIATDTDSGD